MLANLRELAALVSGITAGVCGLLLWQEVFARAAECPATTVTSQAGSTTVAKTVTRVVRQYLPAAPAGTATARTPTHPSSNIVTIPESASYTPGPGLVTETIETTTEAATTATASSVSSVVPRPREPQYALGVSAVWPGLPDIVSAPGNAKFGVSVGRRLLGPAWVDARAEFTVRPNVTWQGLGVGLRWEF